MTFIDHSSVLHRFISAHWLWHCPCHATRSFVPKHTFLRKNGTVLTIGECKKSKKKREMKPAMKPSRAHSLIFCLFLFIVVCNVRKALEQEASRVSALSLRELTTHYTLHIMLWHGCRVMYWGWGTNTVCSVQYG